MENAILNNLLLNVKQDMQITFNDEDSRITNIIKNGVLKLKTVCGVADEDFLGGGKANALLLAYCRRAFDGDIVNFDKDYLSDIMLLKTESEVLQYESETENI